MAGNSIVVLLGLLFGMSAVTAGEIEPVLQSWSVRPDSAATMDLVADLFSVEHRHGDRFDVIVPADQRETLLALVPDAELLEADISVSVEQAFADPAVAAGYRNFSEVQALLNQIAADHPDFAQVVQYGRSQGGLPLLALKLSDNVATDEDEPELMITAATHGDEWISTEVLLRLVEKMVADHGRDPRLSALIDEHELFIIPVVNPDGFVDRRRNDHGRDPNRSYPWPGKPDARPTASIAALIQFFHGHEFAGSLDLHASGGMIMYPWAYTADVITDQADWKFFDDLATSMAEKNEYEAGQISKTIYIAKGSSCDYYYWKKKTRAMAIEIGDSKVPPAADIPEDVEAIAEPLWRFIEAFSG
jgi:hypothetical protein